MEYHSLTLYFNSGLDEIESYTTRLRAFISENGLNNPDNDPFDGFDLNKSFFNHKKNINTDFYYSKSLNNEIRILFGSEYPSLDSEKPVRWFTFTLLFRTCDLAEDKNNGDVLSSDYNYSEESKWIIKSLALKLFHAIPTGYVFFENEYQGGIITELIESDVIEEQETDFEYAVLPIDKKSEIFQATGSSIRKGWYRILCNKRFE